MRYLQVPATARASFYLYNTTDDVDRLIEGLVEARSVFGLGS
jgi:cysteine desulfurase/selenocysteine lyase